MTGAYSGSIPAQSALTHFRTDDKMIAEYLLSHDKVFRGWKRRINGLHEQPEHVRKRR